MEGFIQFCTHIPLKVCIALVCSAILTGLYCLVSKRRRTLANGIVVSLPVILFSFTIITLVCNIPFWDDYDAILHYLTLDPQSRLRHLFAFHNEHRIFFPRICFELIRCSIGTFNFTYCILLGDMILLAYVFLLGKKIVNFSSFACFVPFAWLFLDLANYENTLWALTAIQSHAVLLFSLLACHFCNKSIYRPNNLVASIFFAFLATYTSGSGMGIWPVLAILYMKKTWDAHHSLRPVFSASFASLLLAAAISVGCYMIGFAANSAALTAQNPPIKTTLMLGLINRIDFSLSFLGAIVPFHAIAFPLGLITIGLLIFIVINRQKIKNDVILAFLLYLLTIVGSGALFRGSSGGAAAAALRYGIVSFSILACITALSEELVVQHYAKLIPFKNLMVRFFMFGCILINLSVLLLGYDLVNIRKNNLLRGIANRDSSAEGLQYPEKNKGLEILNRATQKGVYLPPDFVQ